MYPASFFFEVSSTAYIALICINLFVGMNTTIATFVLEFFDDDPVSTFSLVQRNKFCTVERIGPTRKLYCGDWCMEQNGSNEKTTVASHAKEIFI